MSTAVLSSVCSQIKVKTHIGTEIGSALVHDKHSIIEVSQLCHFGREFTFASGSKVTHRADHCCYRTALITNVVTIHFSQ